MELDWPCISLNPLSPIRPGSRKLIAFGRADYGEEAEADYDGPAAPGQFPRDFRMTCSSLPKPKGSHELVGSLARLEPDLAGHMK